MRNEDSVLGIGCRSYSLAIRPGLENRYRSKSHIKPNFRFQVELDTQAWNTSARTEEEHPPHRTRYTHMTVATIPACSCGPGQVTIHRCAIPGSQTTVLSLPELTFIFPDTPGNQFETSTNARPGSLLLQGLWPEIR